MNLYEIDTLRGTTHQLSKFACGSAPTGGMVVYANNNREAQELWFRFCDGERDLLGDIMIERQDYPYRNIICDTKYHIDEKDEE